MTLRKEGSMIHLATFSNEVEAQMLASRLKEADIDHEIEQEDGSDECRVMIFEDDLEEATEIMEAAAFSDDELFSEDLGDLDDLDLEDMDDEL